MSNSTNKSLLVSIAGPTAAGKTKVAIQIAKTWNTEIISADSRQLFRELNVGTAKPSTEELKEIKHHFINSHSIVQAYSAGQYGREAIDLIESLQKQFQIIVAVGGSTLYLKSLWEGFDEMPISKQGIREELNQLYEKEGLGFLQGELLEHDPEYHHMVDLNNHQRVIRALEVIRSTGKKFSDYRKNIKQDIPYDVLKIGIDMDREILTKRIEQRMDEMIAQGLFEEVADLYPFKDFNALQTVGYSEIFDYMDGQYDKSEAIRLLKRNSRRYAKRQMTWFRKYQDIHWFKNDDIDSINELIKKTLDSQ